MHGLCAWAQASGLTATVFGGYGFIGSYVVSELGKRGSQMVVPSRTDENKVQHIRQMGDLGQVRMCTCARMLHEALYMVPAVPFMLEHHK